jgi:thymidine kinase
VTREVDFVIPADGDVETIYAEHADFVDHDALIESIDAPKAPVACLLIDEAQFLSPDQVDSLMRIATTASVPVMCYGIRTDFQTKAFPGSARLLEIAHTLEELKTICRCGRKAMFNGRLVDGAVHLRRRSGRHRRQFRDL